MVLSFADGRKTLSVRLTDGTDDPAHGLASLASPLGQALAGREEDEEIDLPFEGGLRTALVEHIERVPPAGFPVA